jgi:hypothetical protein
VRNIYLTVIILFSAANSFAQDTVERKNRLTDSVLERFYVLKSDETIKQGPYKALFKRRITVAFGHYTQNKKTGIWDFYGTNGNLIEKYNYDTNTFLYEGYLKKNSYLAFMFDEKINKTDTVTRPIKIGGSYYGYIPYLNIFQLPFDANATDTNTDYINAVIELLVSPGGRLADYKVHLDSKYYNYHETYTLDVNLLNEEDRIFVPALLNGEPILSRVFINCYINRQGGLDFY